MALTAQQIAQARDWINTQWSTDTAIGLSGGAAFAPDGSYVTSWDQRNVGVLGAAQGMGYGDADLAQILRLPESTITAFRQANAASVDVAASVFAADRAAPPAYLTTVNNPAPLFTVAAQPAADTGRLTNPATATNPQAAPISPGPVAAPAAAPRLSPLLLAAAAAGALLVLG